MPFQLPVALAFLTRISSQKNITIETKEKSFHKTLAAGSSLAVDKQTNIGGC